MALWIAVKVHPATDTKGKRVSVQIKDKHPRRYYAWDHTQDAGANLRRAAYTYAGEILAAAGYAIDTPVLTEYVSTENGLPIGFGWEN